MGRGVSFVAFGEPPPSDLDPLRTGEYASASVALHKVRAHARLTGFGKRLEGTSGAGFVGGSSAEWKRTSGWTSATVWFSRSIDNL